jgi:spermidine/putrescine transport system substrate-binding protein
MAAGPDPPAGISFANWPGYIDRDPADPQQSPTLAGFTRRTGITVRYSEPITGLLGYSLPWQAGLTGIGYNLAATGRPVRSMTDLLTSPDLRGRVSLVTDMRDDMGLILLDQGHDPAAFSNAEFDLTLDILDRAVRAGQIRSVTNQYPDALDRGDDIAACVAWAGDLMALRRRNPAVHFVLPEAGGMLWTDNMMIPAHAQHAAEAQRLMDYYYEPPVAAQLATALLFICPVAGAEPWAGRLGAGLTGQQYVFPPRETLAAAHYFRQLTPVENSIYTERFTSVLGL